MKNKLIIFFSFLLCALATFSVVLYENNSELLFEIEKREELIKKSQTNDSLNCEHTEKYVTTVTKHITNDCGILIDNKKVTLDEFIRIYSEEVNKSSDLESQIFRLRDSTSILTRQLELIKKRYSVQASTKIDGNYRVTSVESAKIDSALILLPHFRDRLSYDSVKLEWTIIISKGKP